MPIRVLIVDDSSTMRTMLRHVLSSDPELEVVGEAADPYEARDAVKQLRPDVLTLDVEMPRMSGLEFLQKLMAARPMPVVMVSSLTRAGAEDTLSALELGAVDFIAKPSGANAMEALSVLPYKVREASKARLMQPAPAPHPVGESQQAQKAERFNPGRNVVAIGASTGGVDALLTVLSNFPENCPPTVIVQHMPAKFTSSFAKRLNGRTRMNVAEATDGAQLRPGHVYLAPGGTQHLYLDYRAGIQCRLREGEPRSGHSPSVDELFESVADLGKRALGVLLTGMGSDGAEGLKRIRNEGGRTIGQNKATSTVYGMPRVAFEMGAVQRQLPLNLIGPAILEACNVDI